VCSIIFETDFRQPLDNPFPLAAAQMTNEEREKGKIV
jgi:hypothetical protein